MVVPIWLHCHKLSVGFLHCPDRERILSDADIMATMDERFLDLRVFWRHLNVGCIAGADPPSLSPLARRMVAVIIFEGAAQIVVIALAPWLGTGLRNLAILGVYSLALLASLAFVLSEAWRRGGWPRGGRSV